MAPIAPTVAVNCGRRQHLDCMAPSANCTLHTRSPRSMKDVSSIRVSGEGLEKSLDDQQCACPVDDGAVMTVHRDCNSTSSDLAGLNLLLDRCANPEPEFDHCGSNFNDGETATAVFTNALLASGANIPNSPSVPISDNSSYSRQKAARPNVLMADEVLKRRKGAQLDFPTSSRPHMHSSQHQQIVNDQGSLRSSHERVVAQQYQHRQQQQQHQQHLPRTSPSISQSSLSSTGRISLGGGGHGSLNDQSDSVPIIHPTPMFQRLVSDGVQELKAYARIIENQNRRMLELETGHRDLEVRVEMQSKRCLDLEETLEHRELIWMDQIRELEKDRDQWKELVNVERAMNARLKDQVVRKDQDIQRMLQRKYDGRITGSIRNAQHPTHKSPTITNGGDNVALTSSPSHNGFAHHRSPHDFFTAHGSTEAVREQHVADALANFFGLM